MIFYGIGSARVILLLYHSHRLAVKARNALHDKKFIRPLSSVYLRNNGPPDPSQYATAFIIIDSSIFNYIVATPAWELGNQFES